MHQKKQYIFNYAEFGPYLGSDYVGGTGLPNFVLIAEYMTDFDAHSYPSYFKRYYDTSKKTDVSVNTPNSFSFVEYIVFRISSVTATTPWDRLRSTVGGPATGDVDVTRVLKLYDASGAFIDPARYGLTYTVKDNLFVQESSSTTAKFSFLEIRRDPLNTHGALSGNDFYFTFESNGLTYLVDKVTIALAGYDVWSAASANTIIDQISATADASDFTVYVDLVSCGLTGSQVENAFRSIQMTLYKNGAIWDTLATASPTSYSMVGNGVTFTFKANQTFSAAGDIYGLEIRAPGMPNSYQNAFLFSIG